MLPDNPPEGKIVLMKLVGFVLLIFYANTVGQMQLAPPTAQTANRTVLLKHGLESDLAEQDISRLIAKNCHHLSISSTASNFDYVLVTASNTKSGTGRIASIYDKNGILIHSSGSRPSTAVKEICDALDLAVLIEVVDTNNLVQTSDLRNAPSQPGIAGITDAIHGRRNTHTDNATLSVIANGEHALLDCYEHHKGCTTIAPGKYYAEIEGGSMWIDYEMPITHEPKRNHYVLAGGW
jgi:hypothetical protein